MCLRYSFSKYCMLSSFIPSKSKRGWDIIFKGSFWNFFVLLIFCEKASASEGCITMTRVWRHCVLCSAPTGFPGRHRRWDRVQHLRGPQVGPSQSAGGALELEGRASRDGQGGQGHARQQRTAFSVQKRRHSPSSSWTDTSTHSLGKLSEKSCLRKQAPPFIPSQKKSQWNA